MKREQRDTKEKQKSPASLRDEILSKLSKGEVDVREREVSVTTRLGKEFVELLDALVELGLFKSRSETVAAIVMKTLLADRDLFDQLKEQASKQKEMHEKTRKLALRALLEEP